MLKLKCISINKQLQPQTGKVVWVVTMQIVAGGNVQGGQAQAQYGAAPAYDVGDELTADKAPAA